MNNKTLLLTGTTGFVGYKFLLFALSNNFLVIDVLRTKNKKNKKIKKLREAYPKKYKNIFFADNNSLSKKLKNVKADYFINEVVGERKNLNNSILKREKYNLIKEIKSKYDYKNFFLQK